MLALRTAPSGREDAKAPRRLLALPAAGAPITGTGTDAGLAGANTKSPFARTVSMPVIRPSRGSMTAMAGPKATGCKVPGKRTRVALIVAPAGPVARSSMLPVTVWPACAVAMVLGATNDDTESSTGKSRPSTTGVQQDPTGSTGRLHARAVCIAQKPFTMLCLL